MSITETSERQLASYEIHRRARMDRNLALHGTVQSLIRKFASGLQGLARTSKRLAIRGANEWYHRRAIRALHRLDDHMLADIGLSRGDIEFVVRCGPPWQARSDAKATAPQRQAA